MDKVKITSTLKHEVYVSVPEFNFRRTWPMAGSTNSVDKDLLVELMNDIGFRNMINNGILYIEDMDTKKELGLEPEDAEAPVNIIVLSDKEKETYLKVLGMTAFKDKVKKLSIAQVEELCDYAIDNKIVNLDKCKVLKEICGRDVISAIKLLEDDKED